MFDFLKTILTLTIASSSLALTLNFTPSPAFAQDDENRPPFVSPKCDAEMILEHKPTLTYEKYKEVIDVMQEIGAIAQDYADELRKLLVEAYNTPDEKLYEWMVSHCKDKAKTY